MNNQTEAKAALMKAWPEIRKQSLRTFGSELYYQALIYHCLRVKGGIPGKQLGMNVKMRIDAPVCKYFRQEARTRAVGYKGIVEPTPDIVIFKESINGDWRRRNYKNTLRNMLMAIEVKASERDNDRLQPGEIIPDIMKLTSLREEVQHFGASVIPVMIILDSALDEKERMTSASLNDVRTCVKGQKVCLFYLSPKNDWKTGW